MSWSFLWPLAGPSLARAFAPARHVPPAALRPAPEAVAELRDLALREEVLAARLQALQVWPEGGGASPLASLRAPVERHLALLSLEEAAVRETLALLRQRLLAGQVSGEAVRLASRELASALAEQERLVELLTADRESVLAAEAAIAGSGLMEDRLSRAEAERQELAAELAATRAALERERLASAELRRELGQQARRANSSLAGVLELVGLDLETALGEAQGEALGEAGASSAAPAARASALRELALSLPLAAPLASYRVTSRFGEERETGPEGSAVHFGLDMAAPLGTTVASTAPGRVSYAGWRGHYGRLVEVEHGHGLRTRYGHLKSIAVKTGQEVGRGEKLGLVGSSGRSTGPHLHYEVLYRDRPLDPQRFLGAGRRLYESAELGALN